MSTPPASPTSVDAVIGRLADAGYVADRRLATAVFLALTLRGRCSSRASRASARPSSPRRWRRALAALLLRVQCYEGLDIAQTAYEWNVARADDGDPPRRGGARRRRRGGARAPRQEPVLARDADRAAAAAGADAGALAGAADRRARPRRRAVRRLPARGAGREPADDPRAGHDQGRARRRSSSSPATARARSTTR